MVYTQIEILKAIAEIAIFLILMGIIKIIRDYLGKKSYRILNPKEYFPDEEIHSLKQIFYLIMMALFFINILYSLIMPKNDVIYLALLDIFISLYVAVTLDKSTLKNKILVLLLIPFGSLTYILFRYSLVGFLDLLHVPIFIYLIKLYYDKFKMYTKSNGLGITIILLFIIIFLSFLFTQIVEGVNALDSLVMVSNAFTSNGYAVLGSTILGKIDAILLVWAGYILSGVGTATLTAAILIRHYNSKLKEHDDNINQINVKLDELKDNDDKINQMDAKLDELKDLIKNKD